jgi:hypothetical protein
VNPFFDPKLDTNSDEERGKDAQAEGNSITEGFHNKMELLNRQAYGFRNFENYRLRVKVLCGQSVWFLGMPQLLAWSLEPRLVGGGNVSA